MKNSASTDADCAPNTAPAPETLEIPGYVVERELGRGGMAAVYLATELSTSRQVALKVLRRAAARGRMEARFEQEARLGARFCHPDVVRVHGHGRTEEYLWMAMEYLHGFELTRAMEDPAFGLQDRINVIIRVAAALDHVHRQGILHRDIKPSNIFMTYDGGVRLLDFGIARAALNIRLTQSGVLVGTPQYMAPEQLTDEDIDHRADIFSLGVVLYESLTGSFPWPADNPGRLIVDVCTRPPIPLTTAMEHREWLSDDSRLAALEQIVMQAISVQRETRFPHAIDLAKSLGAFLSGEVMIAASAEMQSAQTSDALWSTRRIEWARARAARLELEGSVDLPRSPARKTVDHASIDEDGSPEKVWMLLMVTLGIGFAVALWFVLSA